MISKLLPQMLYQRFFVMMLNISNFFYQKLTYDELRFFASGVKECRLIDSQITYDNGEAIPLENQLPLFSNCEEIDVSSTCESYVALADACQRIKRVQCDVHKEFDGIGFYQYLKKIKNRSLIDINLLNDQDIDGVIDEILNTDSFDFVPPVFYGYEEYERMQEIQEKVAKNFV